MYLIKKQYHAINNYIPNWYKLGPRYRRFINFLSTSEGWSDEKKKEYQLKRLKDIVLYCYNNVPYYKSTFDKNSINPHINSFNEFLKIPIISKKEIIDNTDDLISKQYSKKKLLVKTTGGSTGDALIFYKSSADALLESAFVDYAISKIGISNSRKYKKIIIRGNKPYNNKLYEHIGNNLVLSSYMLSNKNFDKYIKLIESFNPDMMHVYPSSILLLAKYINNSGINICMNNLKGILASSETFTMEQKQIVSDIFKVPICDLYGNTEHTVLGLEYFNNKRFEFVFQYGFVEIINNEVISTSFNDLAMPFLRYNTNDFVNKKGNEIIGIDGRAQDFMLDINNTPISIAAINMHDNTFIGLEQYQFQQHQPGFVDLFIVLSKDGAFDENNMIKKLNMKLNMKITINVKYVNNIPRTERGKHRYLIQNINK
jgi:phenylacetate-CoA ligase